MAKIDRLGYDSWAEFKHDIVAHLFVTDTFQRDRYLFRGVRSSEWRLVPSFDRLFSHVHAKERLAKFSTMMAAFRKECEAHDVVPSVLTSETMLMALGQHSGLPTRLLDWSDSPYIAAFFAYCDAIASSEEEEMVAVWVLHLENEVWSEELGVQILTVPSIANLRMRNQGGKFTLSRTPFVSLEDHVESSQTSEVALTQITLPAWEAGRALADLDIMGINYSRLFPDLGGAAAATKMRILLGDL